MQASSIPIEKEIPHIMCPLTKNPCYKKVSFWQTKPKPLLKPWFLTQLVLILIHTLLFQYFHTDIIEEKFNS